MNLNGTRPQALKNRIAVVSGAAHGIGKAIAGRFLWEGAQVILLDRDVLAGIAAATEISGDQSPLSAEFLATDILRVDEIQAAVQKIRERHGRIDILVNNAGVEIGKPFAETTLEDWDTVLGVNLRGAFALTQAALPLFPAKGGAIVNISSVHATHAFPDSVAYACSKAGLGSLTRNLALELAPRGIRVNAIRPGYIDTRLWDEYLRHSSNPEALAAQTTELHPLGRRGMPADVADAALFLVAENSSFITGTDMLVDGGLTVRAHS